LEVLSPPGPWELLYLRARAGAELDLCGER